MNRFIKNRNLFLLVAINLLWLNAIFSQVVNVNLTSTGELLSLVLKTNNGNIAIDRDFFNSSSKETSHSISYEEGKIKQIDNFHFTYYTNDHKGKISKIGDDVFRYYDQSNSHGIVGKLKEISGVDIKYHTSGTDLGKIQKVNTHYLHYSNGKLNKEECFTENNIIFWIHDSQARYYKLLSSKSEQNSALSSIIMNSGSLVPPPSSYIPSIPTYSYTSSYYKSNYFRVKKERQVLKFMGDQCFKIINEGDDFVTSTPVKCSLYSGNYKLVRDEIFVLRYDDKVCFEGELVDGEYLIFERRECPKGKEKYRLIYH